MAVRIAAVAALLIAVVFVGSELLVPGMAERDLRRDLAERGTVQDVEVSAFPALRLLFGRADRVEVRMLDARLDGRPLADLIARTRDTEELDARVETLAVGPLRVRDVRMAKDGRVLRSEGLVSDADIAAAVPVGLGLRPVAGDGSELVMEATAFGVAVRARLAARDGALVVAPEGLFGGLATLTLFDDPRVRVTGVGARAYEDGFTVSAEADAG